MPSTTARTAITAIIPTISARLSFEPNVRIANDFSHSGVASIAAFPTATSGEAWSSMNEASTSATPKAKAAVSRPIAAPRSRRVRAGSDAVVADLVWTLTLGVRHGGLGGPIAGPDGPLVNGTASTVNLWDAWSVSPVDEEEPRWTTRRSESSW